MLQCGFPRQQVRGARGPRYAPCPGETPAVSKKGVWRGYPKKAKKGRFWGIFPKMGKTGRFGPRRALFGPRAPGGVPRYRGAPARGVDVKPPLAPGSGARIRGSREPQVSRTPPGSPGRSGGPSGAPPGGLGPPPGAPRARVLHQPLAPGPRGSRPGSEGPSRDPGVWHPGPGTPGGYPRPVQGLGTRRRVGGGPPQVGIR